MFNSAVARRYVDTFGRKGLDSTAGPMVAALADRGMAGLSVLEVGAGSGTALVSLVEAGAATAVGVDLSAAYEPVARSLFEQRGTADATRWVTGDFLEVAPDLGIADVVFANRVVCCYPEMEGMVTLASGKARRYLALSFPRDRWIFRTGSALINLWMRIRRVPFRTYLHDPEAIVQRVESSGFREVDRGSTMSWHWVVWERGAAA